MGSVGMFGATCHSAGYYHQYTNNTAVFFIFKAFSIIPLYWSKFWYLVEVNIIACLLYRVLLSSRNLHQVGISQEMAQVFRTWIQLLVTQHPTGFAAAENSLYGIIPSYLGEGCKPTVYAKVPLLYLPSYGIWTVWDVSWQGESYNRGKCKASIWRWWGILSQKRCDHHLWTHCNAKEPEKHGFHLVMDRLNFGAMKMWFLENPPSKATIHVENVDDFKWLNSSYCPVLRQLESVAMKEDYFKVDHPTTLAAGFSNLKYRNPKYLSMLNHLRFYLPQVYPKLDSYYKDYDFKHTLLSPSRKNWRKLEFWPLALN